jgi:hypothetical protein
MSHTDNKPEERLCWLRFHGRCDTGVTGQSNIETGILFARNICKTIKDLVPAGTAIRGMLEQAYEHPETSVQVLLRFTNIEAWMEWVLAGYPRSEDNSLSGADHRWARSRGSMFPMSSNGMPSLVGPTDWQIPSLYNRLGDGQPEAWYFNHPRPEEFEKEIHNRLNKAGTNEVYRWPWCERCIGSPVGEPCLCVQFT